MISIVWGVEGLRFLNTVKTKNMSTTINVYGINFQNQVLYISTRKFSRNLSLSQLLRCQLFQGPSLAFRGASAFLKHAFREVTFGFCKGTVPGAPPLPSPGP